jgi:hypothetical protein
LKIDRKQTDTIRDIATETDSVAEIATETETKAETGTGSIRVGTRKCGGPAGQSGMYSVPSHRLTKISRGRRNQEQSIGFYAFRKSSITCTLIVRNVFWVMKCRRNRISFDSFVLLARLILRVLSV